MIAAFQPRALGALDYGVILAFLSLNLVIGWWFSRKRRSSGDFFLGNKIAWWAVGISFYATATSSLSFMALPAWTYAGNWLVLGAAPAQAAAIIVIAFVFAGFLRRLNATTIYEYLEKRFDRRVWMVGAVLGILTTIIGRMSVVLLLPALALSTVTGINVYLSIFLMGVVTIIYSMQGGFSAVIWTDVIQSVVMLGGVLFAFIALADGLPGGLGDVFAMGIPAGKFELISWAPDLTQPTVLVFVGMGLASLFTQMADQSLMQRVFATADARTAKRTLLLGAAIGLPSSVLFFFVGTCLWAFYAANPERLPDDLANDAIFPFFIANEFPVGLVGLIIAGLFAASMSTLSSAVNSTSAIVVRDFYEILRPLSNEAEKVRVARTATLIAGLVATLMAAYLASLDVQSLWEQFLFLIALVGGGFPGVFALGFLTRRAGSTGVIVGAIGSIGVTWWAQTFTDTSVFLHTFIAITSCVVIGYLVSLCIPYEKKDLSNLTMFDITK